MLTNAQQSSYDAIASDLQVSPNVLRGVRRLVFDYAQIGTDDDVVVIYSSEVRNAVSLVCLVLRLEGFDYSLVPMKPLSDCGLSDRLRERIPENRAGPGKTVALVFEWETMSHNQLFRDIFRGHLPEKRQIVRCINAGNDLFELGLQPLPETISRNNADLLSFLDCSQEMRIRTDAGTALDVELDPSRYDWISNRGMCEAGRMIMLPAGEVATFPAKIEGTLVADFAINVNSRFEGDVRLHKTPVEVQIANNELGSGPIKGIPKAGLA